LNFHGIPNLDRVMMASLLGCMFDGWQLVELPLAQQLAKRYLTAGKNERTCLQFE
jgi:hypothetical protein